MAEVQVDEEVEEEEAVDVTKRVELKETGEGKVVVVDMDVQPSRELRLTKRGGNLVIAAVTTDINYNPYGDVDWEVKAAEEKDAKQPKPLKN